MCYLPNWRSALGICCPRSCMIVQSRLREIFSLCIFSPLFVYTFTFSESFSLLLACMRGPYSRIPDSSSAMQSGPQVHQFCNCLVLPSINKLVKWLYFPIFPNDVVVVLHTSVRRLHRAKDENISTFARRREL